MKIHVFYPKKGACISIHRSFEPLMKELSHEHEVTEFHVPFAGGNPINMWKNILYVRKHRVKGGVNHIAGDIHYCMLGLTGVPSVLTIHDDYAMRTAHRGFLDKIHKYIMWLWLPIKIANKVVCISPATSRNIKRYVKTNKIQMVSQHCMNEDFKYSPKTFCKDTPVIFQCGTGEHKNLTTTIKAIENIKCQLRVLKKMSDTQTALAGKLGIDYVNKYDISNEEVIKEYQNADIIMFPSDFEGFGMPIIEGQCTGRIVITTNREPMNWVAGQDGAIFVDDPKNYEELRCAIDIAINDKNKRERIIANGLENVKRFSLSNIYDNYIRIYQEALHNIRYPITENVRSTDVIGD